MRFLIPARICVSVVISLLLIFATSVNGEDERATELVRMYVDYERTMLVIVSQGGAGAVRFFDGFEKGNEDGNGVVGCTYEWRYLERKPDAVEQTGRDRVFAKLADHTVQRGSLMVKCGPLEFLWDHKATNAGSVRYDPTSLAVHPVAAEYFAERPGGAGDARTKAVDLSSFLYLDSAATKKHRDEVYNGPDTEVRSFAGQVAGPIPYNTCVVVAKDPHGVATFKFGQAFERKIDKEQKLYGVSYDFTFTSHDRKVIQEGKGEVYERYKGDQYDRGRLYLEAGPVHFQWSRGGDDLGWVYSDPNWIRVSYVDAVHAKALVNAMIASDLLPKSIAE